DRALALVQGAVVAVVRAGGARVARRMLAGGARAVALVEGAGVAVVRAGGARVPGRVLAGRGADRAIAHVGGAGVAIIRAGRAGRLHGVGRTRRAGAGTGFGQVALVHGVAADVRAGLEGA